MGFHFGFPKALPEQLPKLGTIVGWAKDFSGTPAGSNNWVECNGQTLSDAQSIYNGLTLPSLNSTQLFLRGKTVSGDTSGWIQDVWQGCFQDVDNNLDYSCTSAVVDGCMTLGANIPPCYTVVWVMRVK